MKSNKEPKKIGAVDKFTQEEMFVIEGLIAALNEGLSILMPQCEDFMLALRLGPRTVIASTAECTMCILDSINEAAAAAGFKHKGEELQEEIENLKAETRH